MKQEDELQGAWRNGLAFSWKGKESRHKHLPEG